MMQLQLILVVKFFLSFPSLFFLSVTYDIIEINFSNVILMVCHKMSSIDVPYRELLTSVAKPGIYIWGGPNIKLDNKFFCVYILIISILIVIYIQFNNQNSKVYYL